MTERSHVCPPRDLAFKIPGFQAWLRAQGLRFKDYFGQRKMGWSALGPFLFEQAKRRYEGIPDGLRNALLAIERLHADAPEETWARIEGYLHGQLDALPEKPRGQPPKAAGAGSQAAPPDRP